MRTTSIQDGINQKSSKLDAISSTVRGLSNMNLSQKLTAMKESMTQYFQNMTQATAETFSWLCIVVLNLATVPSFIAVMSGLTSRMPPLDIVVLMWGALLLYFIRSAILKDMLMVVTIGVGFAIQAIMLGFIFFT